MKTSRLLSVTLVMLIATCVSLQSNAQNFRSKVAYLNTSDSSIQTISTVPIQPNEAGILTVNFVGYAQNDAGACTSIQVVRYINVAGTITLGAPAAILATASDASITTSAVSFTVSGNNILIRVKAGRPVPVRWQAAISKESRVKNN